MLHIITGPPCGGKSTYVREHAKDGDLRVDYDQIAKALGSVNEHAAEGLIRKAAFEARAGAIKAALKDTESESWIIHTRPTPEQMRAYEAAGAEFIELDPGKDVCLERARQDGRPDQTFEGIESWYSERKGNDMEHLYKSFEIKADEKDSGTISGYFSTYDRIPDAYGDIIAPGAFAETIQKRAESGHPFPLCWNHDLDQIIGSVDPADIKDDEHGPLMTAKFFDTPLAQEKREIVKSGVVYQFSFAYDVLEAGPVELENGLKANELKKVDLFEVSIVPIPANQNAVMTEIKSGRRNSKKDEDTIRKAIALLESVLEDEADDQAAAEDEPEDNGAPEDQKDSNAEKKASLLEYIKQMEV